MASSTGDGIACGINDGDIEITSLFVVFVEFAVEIVLNGRNERMMKNTRSLLNLSWRFNVICLILVFYFVLIEFLQRDESSIFTLLISYIFSGLRLIKDRQVFF